VKRVLTVVTVGAAALAAQAGVAKATNECRGLNPCVPVAGPWVVVPIGRSVPRPQVQYQLACPRGYVDGGIDAELTAPAIDLTFLGKSGSPVNPGITTSRTVVFVATYVGMSASSATFRPHIGCIRASGGGGRRTPTSVSAVVPPGAPTVRRVRNVRIGASTSGWIAQGCASAERLVAAYHAFGFYTAKPPTADVIAGLRGTQSVRGDRVVVSVHGGRALRGVRAVVQVAAVCAGGT
jgi:hypothetical protein